MKMKEKIVLLSVVIMFLWTGFALFLLDYSKTLIPFGKYFPLLLISGSIVLGGAIGIINQGIRLEKQEKD